MRYFPQRHNLTSRIIASLLIILYILTLGPLKEVLAFVIPQNLLPAPILSSQITKFSSIAGKYDQVCRYNPTAKKFEYFVLDNPEYTKFTTLEPAKGYQVNLSSECILRITGRLSNANYSSSLVPGWQMLGYYSKNRIKVSDALANLVKGTNYDRISRYDKAANTFVDLAPGDYLEQGVSYFIRVLKNSTLTVLPKPDVIDLTEFAYNADGSRVKKIVNGISTTAYIGELFEIREQGTGDRVQVKHIFAGANRVCSVTKDEARGTTDASYYHSDHLGSSSVITSASGAQLQLAEYKPYGSLSRNEPANRQTGSPVHHYFTGKELDSTGLYYARYYDPKIGRFITPDPITQNLYDPQNLNAYTYVRNNPLRYIDPTGNSAWDNTGNWWGDWSNYENKNYFIQSTNSFTLRGTSYINSFGLALSSSFSNYLRSEKQFLQNGINPILSAIKTGNWQPLWQETKLQLSQPFDRDHTLSMVMMVSGGVKFGKVKPTGYRYVGAEEAAKIAETGYIPNISRSGILKNVFYTPDGPLTSASQAKSMYGLKTLPTHRIGLNTNGITNIYGGNVKGRLGMELVTEESISALDIQGLGD